MTDYGSIGLDKNLRPVDSPVVRNVTANVDSYDIDSTYERGGINTVQVRDSSITSEKLTGTITTSYSGTITNAFIGTSQMTGGSIANPVIGTPSISAGTIKNILLGTSQITGGTLANAYIGTPNLSGGTVDAALFKIGGSAGIDATLVYVGSIDFAGSTNTYGTAVFSKGILISSA